MEWQYEGPLCMGHPDMAFSLEVDADGVSALHSHVEPAQVAYVLRELADQISAKLAEHQAERT